MEREATSLDVPSLSEPARAWADRYAKLWASGPPDLDQFLRAAPGLSRDEVAAVLAVDQRLRWQIGERVRAEEYLRRLADFPPDANTIVNLIFREYRLSKQAGARINPQELFTRFPEHAAVLHAQIAMDNIGADESNDTLNPSSNPHSNNTCQAGSLTSPTQPTIPKVIGRYEVIRALGTGAMGAVYLARDSALDRLVALKVPHLGRDAPGQAQRFRREAHAAAALHHPNLCPVHDVGSADGVEYLAMHYVSGESLGVRIRRTGPLPAPAAVRLLVPIAEAMEFAHRAGIIHRDLKPGNILFNEQDQPVVVDFGLARRAAADDAKITEPGTVLGTPAYMPPEQIGCDPATLGPSSDIYSLGVILYELLTGRTPFQGSTASVLRQLLTDEPTSPAHFRPGLDPRLTAAILRALAKQPEDRFASMAEFVAELKQIESTQTHDAHEGQTVDFKLQPAKSRLQRWPWISAAALIFALVVGYVIWHVPRPASDHGVPIPLSDPFANGAVWEGTFVFHPAEKNTPYTAILTVIARRGESFEGTYMTEDKKYQWEVHGQASNGVIQWRLVKPLNSAAEAVNHRDAKVEGRYSNSHLTATYVDADSQAKIALDLQ